MTCPEPRIGDLAPIGDGQSIALVGPDGGIEFFCPLRFDQHAVIFPLLDRRRGGRLRIGVVDDASHPLRSHRQYRTGSAVLDSHWAGSSGRVRMQLAMAWPAPQNGQELLWLIDCLDGTARIEAVLDARPGFGCQGAHLSVDHLQAAVTT